MYIKEITVKGYKSYANKTVIDTFQRGLNVVIGRNGSGKSNLLSALQMILADEECRKKSRKSMLAMMPTNAFRGESGYVEIIFDNIDGFFPEDSAEVSLKRCIGGKKDKCYINGKSVERFDKYLAQVGLLTPYSFVQQGRINQLATMNDKNRFEVMRVVCGEIGWNTISGQISRIRHESEILFVEITDLVKRVTEMKPILKEQVEELAKYTTANGKKQAAEFVYYSRELSRIQNVLETLAEKKNGVVEELSKLKHKSEEFDGRVDKMNFKVARFNREEKRLKAEITSNQAKIQKLASEIGKLENLRKDYQPNDDDATSSQARNTQKSNIDTIEAEINTISKNCQKYEDRVEKLSQDCYRAEIQVRQLNELMTELKGSENGFRSEIQRKKYVETKLTQLQQLKTKSEQSVAEAQQKVIETQQKITDKQEELDMLDNEKRDHIQSTQKIVAKVSEVETEKYKHEIEKQTNLKELASVEENIFTVKEQQDQLHLRMNRPFGAAVMGSYLGMKRVLDSLQQRENFDPHASGYFGTVLENLHCDEGFETSVHVAAGSKLFQHIVGSYEIAGKLLREYNRLKCHNEVKFIVMNRLMKDNIQYPEDNHVSPLIKHIQFQENVTLAMKFVFGKVLYCINSEVASTYAKNHKFTCVTLDGDKITSSGVMTGGYRDNSFNIMLLEIERRKFAIKTINLENEIQALKDSIEQQSSMLVGLAKALEKCNTQKAAESAALQQILNAKNARREELRNLERSHEAEMLNLARLKKAQLYAEDNIQYFNIITGPSERHKINAEHFNSLIADFKSKTTKLKHASSKMEEERKKRMQLEHELEEARTSDGSPQMDSYLGEVSTIPGVKSLLKDQTDQRLKLVTEAISDAEEQIRENQNILDKIKDEAVVIAQKVEKHQEAKNVLKEEMSKVEVQLTKLQETNYEEQNKYHKTHAFLRQIGSYPSGVDDYSDLSTSQLFKIIKAAQRSLNAANAINHRANEQYEKVKNIVKKFKESGKYFGSVEKQITEILQDIEKNKSGICIGAVRAVQESFRKIFQELVLNATGTRGYGRFILHGDSVEFTETTQLEDGRALWENHEFEGASLKVSFKDWGDEPMRLKDILQLSGGQKSIVALAFLLAIQSVNPQSLYVFDEVDQALDPSYREAVAQKMKELSNNAQFLCTTFRKEFVEYADAFFGISFRNQKSQVRPVSREEALDFVQPDSDLSSPPEDSIIASSLSEQEETAP